MIRILKTVFRFQPYEERTPFTWFITSLCFGFTLTLSLLMLVINIACA